MADDYFGLCPECHRTDGHVTDFTGLDYFACVEHRKRWLVGANLFPQDGAEPKQRFTWEDAAGFEDITRREFRSHDYYCPVCRAPMIGDQKNICDHCRAVWPTHEEVALLHCALDEVERANGEVSKREALAMMVRLGSPSEERADFILRAMDAQLPLDAGPHGWIVEP